MKFIHLLAYEDGTECSELLAHKIQKPGNYPDENIQHIKHGEISEIKKADIFDSFLLCHNVV
jgi:hypothetical protein